MRQIRTDLAMESFQSSSEEGMRGVRVSNWETMGVKMTEVLVEEEAAAKALGKAVGCYMTLECPGLRARDVDARLAVSNLLGEEIARMLHLDADRTVLVAGLGNRRITPDALGPLVVDRTLVTRHMFSQIPEYADRRMQSVCAIAPGVLGVTGVETMEIIESLVQSLRPQAIVCIDSLSARAAARGGATIQLTDTGIQPGSGVGNHRRALTREALGVPVIAIGMPTVIYAATLTCDALEMLTGNDALDEDTLEGVERELLHSDIGELIVTPRDVDDMLCDAAGVIASAVNRALQPQLSEEEILALMN